MESPYSEFPHRSPETFGDPIWTYRYSPPRKACTVLWAVGDATPLPIVALGRGADRVEEDVKNSSFSPAIPHFSPFSVSRWVELLGEQKREESHGHNPSPRCVRYSAGIIMGKKVIEVLKAKAQYFSSLVRSWVSWCTRKEKIDAIS